MIASTIVSYANIANLIKMTIPMEIIKKHKLILSFLLIIVSFFSFGIFTFKGLVTLGNFTKKIHNHPLVVSNAALNAAVEITKMHRCMKDVVLATKQGDIKMELAKIAQNETKVHQHLDIIKENILGKQGQMLERQTHQLFVEWQPIRDEVVDLLELNNKSQAILVTQTKGADHVAVLESKMLELSSYARAKANFFLAQAETKQAHLEKITIILTLFGVLISIIIAFITTFLVLQTKKQLVEERNNLVEAFVEIKTLRGIIPICSHCKQIRDDKGMWNKIEEYIHAHSEASFSHGICPSCIAKYYSDD